MTEQSTTGAVTERNAIAAPAVPITTSDRTVLGLERAGLRPTLAIAGVIALFAVGLPLVNAAIPRSGTVEAGTAVTVAPGVTFAPPGHWKIAGEDLQSISLVYLGASITLVAQPGQSSSASIDEAADSLEATIREGLPPGSQVIGVRNPGTTRTGYPVILDRFVTPEAEGFFAVVASAQSIGFGLKTFVYVFGEAPAGVWNDVSPDYLAMIDTIVIR